MGEGPVGVCLERVVKGRRDEKGVRRFCGILPSYGSEGQIDFACSPCSPEFSRRAESPWAAAISGLAIEMILGDKLGFFLVPLQASGNPIRFRRLNLVPFVGHRASQKRWR